MTGQELTADWEDLDAVAPEWDALADEAGAPPFLRPGWFEAWWPAFGHGTLRVITAREQGRLRGVLPLASGAPMRAPPFKSEPLPLSSRPGALRSPANWYSPEFRPIAVDARATQALARAVLARQPPVVSLAMVYPGHPGVDTFLSGVRAGGRDVILQPLPPSPWIDLTGGWEQFVASRPAKLLADLRRRERRLGEVGPVTYEVHDGRDHGRAALLDEGFAIEPSGWKAAGGSAIISRPETRRFYTDVARWAAEGGWLRLCFLRVAGRAVAFQFALQTDDASFLLKGGYDPTSARFAPGKLLVHHLIERCATSGGSRFEFLGGDEPWKREWTAVVQDRVVAHAFAPTARGALERATVTTIRPWRARTRRHLRNAVAHIRPVG